MNNHITTLQYSIDIQTMLQCSIILYTINPISKSLTNTDVIKEFCDFILECLCALYTVNRIHAQFIIPVLSQASNSILVNCKCVCFKFIWTSTESKGLLINLRKSKIIKRKKNVSSVLYQTMLYQRTYECFHSSKHKIMFLLFFLW